MSNKNEIEIINNHNHFIRNHADSAIKPINEKAIERFKLLGLPNTKHEMYTFVNTKDILSRSFDIVYKNREAADPECVRFHTYSGCENSLIVLVDGFFNKNLSNTSAIDKNINISSLNNIINHEYIDYATDYINKENDIFALLNISFINKGLVLNINSDLDIPIQILNISLGSSSDLVTSNTNVLIRIGHGVKAKLINKFVSASGKYFVNSLQNIDLSSNAELYYTQVQNDHKNSWHFSKSVISLSDNSKFMATNTSSGNRLTRHHYDISFMGNNSKLSLNSLAILEGEEQVHNYVRVNHDGLGCTSNQNFRNILNNKARTSVDTTVVVNKDARLTKSDQLINNLMLSENARADAKPNLMIFNDDVKCTHGATVGQINDDQLLYLKSRGLSDREARSLLTTGFAKGIVEYIPHKPVATNIYNTLFRKLEGTYDKK